MTRQAADHTGNLAAIALGHIMQTMKKSRVHHEIPKTIQGFERLGSLDKRTMRHFSSLMLPPVQNLSPNEIRDLRQHNRISQAVLAALLNTSVSTVQKWEIGEKRPSGPSLKLLNMIQRKGIQSIC